MFGVELYRTVWCLKSIEGKPDRLLAERSKAAAQVGEGLQTACSRHGTCRQPAYKPRK